MKRTLTVAAVQLPAHDREEFDDIWAAIRVRIADAAGNDADIIVLPEGTIPAYVLGDRPLDAEQIDRAVAVLRDDARRLRVLVVCGLGRTHASFQYNSAIVVDTNGDVAGYADKAFLWHFDRRWFAPADAIAPIRTSLGTLGALVCADGRIPTISRALVDAGAELLVMPTAWVTSGRDPDVLENVQADLLARVRARENGVPFVAANKSGTERGCVAYCGKSQIVSGSGEVLAIGPERDPAIVASEIEVGTPRVKRISIPRPAIRAVPPISARIAIAMHDDAAAGAALATLEASYLIAPDAPARVATLDAAIPTALLDDATIADPGAPVAFRRAGYRLLIWDSRSFDPAWIVAFGRARALELKVYVVVLDRVGSRAFAVDPDGVVIAGTFGALHAASFVYDGARTEATLVAPSTDVALGLERIATLVAESPTG
jgi:N-carbamoylputrescine amidase